MDKVILFGVFDFINFHVCKTLLEKGIEVKGIHVENIDRVPYLDEKRFEIGRNANFYEQSIMEWNNQHDSGETIVFSLYDLYMNGKEDILRNEAVTKPILDLLKQNQEKSTIASFLLPAQMAVYPLDERAFRPLRDFLQQSLAVKQELQLIYLPSIYGPWQPQTFLFQRAILTKMNLQENLTEIREGTMDALFVEDAIETMVEIIDSRIPGSYLIESGKKNHWQRCAAYLNIDNNPGKKNKLELDLGKEEIKRVPIKNVTSIDDSLTKQTIHWQRLLEKDQYR